MKEVDVETADLRQELRIDVRLLLEPTPVIGIAPVGS